MSDKQLDTIIGKMDEIKETLELAGRPKVGYVGDPTPGPVIPLSYLLSGQDLNKIMSDHGITPDCYITGGASK